MEWLEGPVFNFTTLLISVLPLMGSWLLRHYLPNRELSSSVHIVALAARPDDPPHTRRHRAITAVWNSGREPIREADIAPRAPLSLLLPASTVPSRAWAEPTLGEGGGELASLGHEMRLSFDFVEPGEGIYADVDFVGAGEGVAIEGYVVGTGRVRQIRTSKWTRTITRGIVSGSGFVGGVVGALLMSVVSNRELALLATAAFALLWGAAAWQLVTAYERRRTLPRAMAQHVWAKIQQMPGYSVP